jgi:hypothetical protein
MFKKIIALLAAIFISGCNSENYIELNGKEFEKELQDSSKSHWIFLGQISREDKNYYYFEEILNENRTDSVVTIVKLVKVKRNQMVVKFDDNDYSSNRPIEMANVLVND